MQADAPFRLEARAKFCFYRATFFFTGDYPAQVSKVGQSICIQRYRLAWLRDMIMTPLTDVQMLCLRRLSAAGAFAALNPGVVSS